MVHFLTVPYRQTDLTEARRVRTREVIVSAALEQLAAGGYASASVQAVARRGGVATGTVYRHFPSKRDLFAEVFRRAAKRELATIARLVQSEDRPARERVALAVEAFARRALAEPGRAYALIAEPVDPAIEVERLAFRRGYRDVFGAVLSDGMASGEIAPCDPQTVAAALVGALGEALVGPLSPAAGASARTGQEALVASLVQFCLNAIPAAARMREARFESHFQHSDSRKAAPHGDH